MSRLRLGVLVVIILALGVASAAATPPTGITGTELARATISGPISASATGESELVGQMITFPPGGIAPWHSHPATLFVLVKSGALTAYTGSAQGCTAASYSAGHGYLERPGEVFYAKNEGSTPAEVYVTYVGLPVGAELRMTEANPGGANCPSETAGPALAATVLARSKMAGPFGVEAAAPFDVSMQRITVEPGGSGGWHSHPAATFVAVKSGTLTIYRGGAAGCTSQSYSAGQGLLEPAGDVHVARNETSTPVELYAAFVAAPVGGELRTDQQSPGGANCPEQATPQAASQLPRTGAALAWILAVLGLGLVGAGAAARSLAQRR
jgi:quercetin dioxygenase-like cupin family protein